VARWRPPSPRAGCCRFAGGARCWCKGTEAEAGARRGCRIAPRLAPEVSDPPASADPAADDLALHWSLLDRPGHDRGSNSVGRRCRAGARFGAEGQGRRSTACARGEGLLWRGTCVVALSLPRTRRREKSRKAREPTVGAALWPEGRPMCGAAGDVQFFQNGLNLSHVRKRAFADWAADLLLETVLCVGALLFSRILFKASCVFFSVLLL
jgi:hypothetical protein